MNDTQAGKTKILLIDDHTLFRESLARLLADEPDFEIAGTCASVGEALAILAARPVDIVLLDLELGGERGSVFFERARGSGFQGRVLVVAAAVSPREAMELVRLGVAGFFLKESPPASLASNIRQLMSGEPVLDQRYLRAVVQMLGPAPVEDRKPELSERERGVLRGVLEGLLNKEIAQQLQISESSVKASVQQLFEKTGVHTRSRLVRIALERYRDQL